MNFWMFMSNLIMPACACVLAYLGCYTMAGWALFGAFLAFTVPHGKIKVDDNLKKRVEKLEKALGDMRPLK